MADVKYGHIRQDVRPTRLILRKGETREQQIDEQHMKKAIIQEKYKKII